MTAKEMFYKLGYVRNKRKGSVLYVRGFGDCILFEDRCVKMSDVHGYDRVCNDCELEKAIIQQMKELGWIE